MSYTKLILQDSPDIVWPLDDITETSSVSAPINFLYDNPNIFSASINTNNTDVLEVPMVFGGGESLLFTSSGVGLSIPALNRFSEVYQNKNSALSFWIKIDQFNNDEQVIMKKRGNDEIGVYLRGNNIIFRHGPSASYSEMVYSVSELAEPHYIFINFNPSNMILAVDGQLSSQILSNFQQLEKDSNHEDNDYIDFYGPKEGSWSIDSPAIYPNPLSDDVLKRHYVYGLGKSVSYDVFYSKGGHLYNFSLMDTKRNLDINWRFPEEWRFVEYQDLSLEEGGVTSLYFEPPELFSQDQKLLLTNNSIKFSNDEKTACSYIEIKKLIPKIQKGDFPLFVKVKLDGELPKKFTSQRIMSYGSVPGQNLLNFDLYNDDDVFKININLNNSDLDVSFTINNISASPSIYLGMKFLDSALFYFAENNSAVQTASLSYVDEEGFGIDPANDFFPPSSEYVLRIGAGMTYDLSQPILYSIVDTSQFLGTFEEFFIAQKDDDAPTDFNYLENYKKKRYGFYYDTSVNRFKVQTYGYGYFHVHAIEMAEEIEDETKYVGANVVDIGYPNTVSSSQVFVYATLEDYSGSVIYPKTQVSSTDYLNFINQKNIHGQYVRFDVEVYAEDRVFYPPFIEYFRMQTFSGSAGPITIQDMGANDYKIYSSGSSFFLPEIRPTPTIFLKENSGLKIQSSQAEFIFNSFSEPLDPRDISGLVLWADSRFPLGFNRQKYLDDSLISTWKDISDSGNNLFTSSSLSVYRTQSLNLFTMNQLNGAEDGIVYKTESNSASVSSKFIGAVSGLRGIEVLPNNTDTDSYMYFTNTASLSVFPNQEYTVVGSLRMNKIQTASALNQYARSIVVYTSSSAASSIATVVSASNVIGIQSLSATFTTGDNVESAEIRFYNGSLSEEDPVYWDNLGLYLVSASPIASWQPPLSSNDSPTIKFDGKSMEFNSSSSAIQPLSLYMVVRSINDNVLISSSPSEFSMYTSSGILFVDAGSSASFFELNNDTNVISLIVNSGSATIYLNDQVSETRHVGHNSLSNLVLGRGVLGGEENYFSGDISSVLLYNTAHELNTVKSISNFLYESFNSSVQILPE